MADVMREYLVSLGFSVDQAKLRTFNDALKGTSSSMAKLGAEVVGTGIALTAMVESVARQFTDLYYMSQRTGSTINSLDAVGFAAQQVGLSADQARGSIEGFASAIRRNPGLAAFYQGLTGKRPTGRSDEDQRTLVRSLSKKPDFIALPQASLFGMDEHTYLQMKNNMVEFDRDMADHQRRMKEAGLNLDADKEKWVDFTRAINHLGDQFSVAGARIAEDWRVPLQGMIEQFDELIGRFGKADVASEGVIGKVTGLMAAFGGVTAVMALLGKLFGFKGSVTPNVMGTAPALLETIDQDSKSGDPLRTGLRALFGIDDPKEGGVGAIGDAFGLGRKNRVSRPWGEPSDSAPYTPPPGQPKTQKSGRVWGDDEAVAAGLYEGTPLPRPRPGGADVTINQNNQFGDVRDLDLTIDRVKETNRELGDALRNHTQKFQ